MVELGEVAVIVERKPVTTRRKRKADEKARKRTISEAARAEYERLKAIADEAEAEDRAPAAQRTNGVAEPDTRRGGFRRPNPLYAMNRRGKGRTITHDHLKAAQCLRNDYELGILRSSSPKSGLGSDGGGGEAQDEEFVWLAAAERYRNALAAMPMSLRGLVEAIVIVGQSVPWIARAIGQSEETTVGLTVAAMDGLADHFWPERDTRAKEIERALARLQPLGFDFAISAIGEVIPQERIGRGRVSVAA